MSVDSDLRFNITPYRKCYVSLVVKREIANF